MVTVAAALSVPTSVEELWAALKEIGKEVDERVAFLNLTDPRKIHEEKRDRVSRLVARIKNEGKMPVEDIRPTLEAWWSTQGERQSAIIRTV